MFGSRTTGLATPSSDFDFSIAPKAGEDKTMAAKDVSMTTLRYKSLGVMRKVEKRLWAAPQFKNSQRIYARVSLVQAVHRFTGAKVDFQAVSPYKASQELIRAWSLEFPSLRALFLTIRTCLASADLNTVFSGGIGSYTLVVMLATALKHANETHDADDLGGQLLHFLSFWGSADLYKYAYSAIPPLVYEKNGTRPIGAEDATLSEADDLQRKGMDEICQSSREKYFLCIQDPADYLNDLGRKSHAIRDIQAVFKRMHKSISEARQLGKEPTSRIGACLDSSAVGNRRSILEAIIPTDFYEFEKARFKLERYAGPPQQRSRPKLRTKDLRLNQQRRAIEFRKRRSLEPLNTDPHAFTGKWRSASGVRYVVPNAGVASDL